MRRPGASTAIWAEPSTWPAGWKVTVTPPSAMRRAEGGRLGAAGEAVAEADRHDVEGLAGGEDGAVAGGGVVGMGVGDERPGDRPHRVDVEVARRAVEALGAGHEEVGGAHGLGVGRARGRPRARAWPRTPAGPSRSGGEEVLQVEPLGDHPEAGRRRRAATRPPGGPSRARRRCRRGRAGRAPATRRGRRRRRARCRPPSAGAARRRGRGASGRGSRCGRARYGPAAAACRRGSPRC